MSENHIFFTIALHKAAGDTDTELFAHDHVVLDGIFCKHQQNDRKNRSIPAFLIHMDFPVQTAWKPQFCHLQKIFYVFQFLLSKERLSYPAGCTANDSKVCGRNSFVSRLPSSVNGIDAIAERQLIRECGATWDSDTESPVPSDLIYPLI